MFDVDFDIEMKSRMQKNSLLSTKIKGLKRLDGKLFVTASILDSCHREKRKHR